MPLGREVLAKSPRDWDIDPRAAYFVRPMKLGKENQCPGL